MSKPTDPGNNAHEAVSFRDLMTEFEDITSQFDDPELDIETAVSLHKRGAELLTELHKRLDQAEQQLNNSVSS
ncbi:exodeoxyribonuclease VII small subunit [Candidatus Saccharibacteria bacterium]|nr:exodeoxyribonuclease VII small subunit [Candidatus Saccharibacteria bacterium]